VEAYWKGSYLETRLLGPDLRLSKNENRFWHVDWELIELPPELKAPEKVAEFLANQVKASR